MGGYVHEKTRYAPSIVHSEEEIWSHKVFTFVQETYDIQQQ